MAICRWCGDEVAPIDKVLRLVRSQAVFFCSEEHALRWEAAEEAPKPVAAAPEEPEKPAPPAISPDSPLAEREIAPKRRPGRPKGSKNRA